MLPFISLNPRSVTSMEAGLQSTKTNTETDGGGLACNLLHTIQVIFLHALLSWFLSFSPGFSGFGCVYFNAASFQSLPFVSFVLRKHCCQCLLCVFTHCSHCGSSCLLSQNLYLKIYSQHLLCYLEIIWFKTINRYCDSLLFCTHRVALVCSPRVVDYTQCYCCCAKSNRIVVMRWGRSLK